MNIKSIDAQPNPEYLIKSISEQGYSLETALSDLIDNSISAKANKIEILRETQENRLSVFIVDNGVGMTKEELIANLQFPSRDMESQRDAKDLGRFGLGLKTASFSQTRKFTVISRKEGTVNYAAMTWDVSHLKTTKKWEIIINTEEEINDFLERYNQVSNSRLEKFNDYSPNTIIIWDDLKNFNNYKDKSKASDHIDEELTQVTSEYLSIVFHKFMEEKDPLKIRINNSLVKPFNPFVSSSGIQARKLEAREMLLASDSLKMQGYVLPVTASEDPADWTTPRKSLMGMEGLYIYRGNRIIFFGGWNGIIKKQARLKLARLKIQVGNSNDDILQLNVAKSKISIPYELKQGALRYISELKMEALKEYSNRGLKKSSSKQSEERSNLKLLERISTTKGRYYSINQEYPLIKIIKKDLSAHSKVSFKTLIKSINSIINEQHHKESFSEVELKQDQISLEDTLATVKQLKALNLTKDYIFDVFLKRNGYDRNNLPQELTNLLNKN